MVGDFVKPSKRENERRRIWKVSILNKPIFFISFFNKLKMSRTQDGWFYNDDRRFTDDVLSDVILKEKPNGNVQRDLWTDSGRSKREKFWRTRSRWISEICWELLSRFNFFLCFLWISLLEDVFKEVCGEKRLAITPYHKRLYDFVCQNSACDSSELICQGIDTINSPNYTESLNVVPFCGPTSLGSDLDLFLKTRPRLFDIVPFSCKVKFSLAVIIGIILSISCLFLNIGVIVVARSSESFRNAYGFYKISLAIADLLVGVVAAPIFTFTILFRGLMPAIDLDHLRATYEIEIPSFGFPPIIFSFVEMTGIIMTVSILASIFTLSFSSQLQIFLATPQLKLSFLWKCSAFSDDHSAQLRFYERALSSAFSHNCSTQLFLNIAQLSSVFTKELSAQFFLKVTQLSSSAFSGGLPAQVRRNFQRLSSTRIFLENLQLCFSSIDRYFAIRFPFKYRRIIGKSLNTRIYFTIGFSWSLALVIAILPFIFPNSKYELTASLLVVGTGRIFYTIYGKAILKLESIFQNLWL